MKYMSTAGSYDHTVQLYDMRCKSSVLKIDHGSPVESVVMFPSGGIIASAGTVNCWPFYRPTFVCWFLCFASVSFFGGKFPSSNCSQFCVVTYYICAFWWASFSAMMQCVDMIWITLQSSETILPFYHSPGLSWRSLPSDAQLHPFGTHSSPTATL